MAFTWYSVGLLEEFDSYSYTSQAINSQYAPSAPYYALSLDGPNRYVRKLLPETVQEVYVSYYFTATRFTDTMKAFYIGTSANPYAYGYLQYSSASGLMEAVIGTTIVGRFPVSLYTKTQIEIRYRNDATAGVFQVWQDGTLVVDYAGEIYDSTKLIDSVYWSSTTGSFGHLYHYISCIVISTSKIGSKRPVIANLNAAGTSVPPKFFDMLGNSTANNNANFSANKTIAFRQNFKYAGTVRTISFRVSTVGTFYVGVVTRNSTNNTKYIRKYVSNQLTTPAVGVVTLESGKDFPADWVVDTNDTLAIFFETAILTGYYDGWAVANYDSLSISGEASYSGNALANATELTYGVSTSAAYYWSMLAQIELSDPTHAYTMSSADERLALRSFIYNFRYAEFNAANQEMLCEIKNLDVVATAIHSVKVTMTGKASGALPNAEWLVKIGEDDLAAFDTLPTSATVIKSKQFDGLWTPAQFNAAKIGIRVKE